MEKDLHIVAVAVDDSQVDVRGVVDGCGGLWDLGQHGGDVGHARVEGQVGAPVRHKADLCVMYAAVRHDLPQEKVSARPCTCCRWLKKHSDA